MTARLVLVVAVVSLAAIVGYLVFAFGAAAPSPALTVPTAPDN